MPVTLSESYPVAGEEITFASTTGDSDVAEYSLTDKPADSALSLGKLVNRQGVAQRVFTADVAGVYNFTLYPKQELCPDPAQGIYLKHLTAETFTVSFGKALYLPLTPTNGHSARLKLTVVGDYVRAAELVDMATTVARNAALDTTVAAAVDALVNVAVSSIDNDLMTNANDLRTAFEAHRVYVHPVHVAADQTNITIAQRAYTNETAIILIRDLAYRIGAHLKIGGGNGAVWHSAEDTKNYLAVAPNVVTLQQATVLSADLRYRVYQRHIAQVSNPAPHGGADATNTLNVTMPLLTAAVVAYLDYVMSASSAAPGNEGAGIALAQSRFGLA